MAFELWFNADVFPIKTVGEPGAHGAGITGTQGIGVRTPNAAAVAAATAGFASDWHIPKGMIFFIGTLSMIVAAGMDDTVFFSGVTIRVEGAIPNEQVHMAPPSTQNPIAYLHPASSSRPTAAIMTSVGVPSIRLAKSLSAICAYLTRFNRISPTTPSSGGVSFSIAIT